MIIYFIRHGHPDYKTDTLTEVGKKQAEAVAERLMGLGIERIYSSTCGRAKETAEPTAKRLGLEIIPLDFIRELSWRSTDGEPILANGHPWHVADALVKEGVDITSENWRETEPYSRSRVVLKEGLVSEGIDSFLEKLGYKREGKYYRASAPDKEKIIAIFSHAGSSSAALGHIFNIPFPQVCGAFRLDFTSVTKVEFPNRVGELVYPQLLLLNDAKHLEGIEAENVFGN